MNPVALLQKYFRQEKSFSIVFEHSRHVAAKAVAIARQLDEPVDLRFVEEAAMLHDIGICMTSAPKIECFGDDHYITHGIHGRNILEREGFHRHALVCERHIGVGLTKDDIRSQNLPLPCRDMFPTCIEEEIISFADLFFSKKPGSLDVEKSIDQVCSGISIFGEEKVRIFTLWREMFDPQ